MIVLTLPCPEDADQDGLCDWDDECVGEYDDCGICNGGNADQDCNGDCFGDAFIDDCVYVLEEIQVMKQIVIKMIVEHVSEIIVHVQVVQMKQHIIIMTDVMIQ